MQKTEQKTEQQAGLGMSFCEEEGRITVFRKTLEALEWPSHYRFLYNRKMKQIAVQACGAEESGAHRVGKPDESNSDEIKCMALVRMIYGDSGWDKKMSYRLIGRAFPQQRLVSFKILTSGGLAAVSSSAFAALYSAFGKYDVVHIHAEGPAFFAWLPKMFGKRVVVTVHGIDWQREKWQSGLGSKFIHQGEKNAAKYADEVIVLSKGVQDYFKETYGRETHFIPNGVNRPQIREASLISTIKNMVNSLYAKDISKKISLSYQMRREKGIPTSWCTPYGYQLNQQGNKFEATEDAKWVKLIYQWYLAGVSTNEIARRLEFLEVARPNERLNRKLHEGDDPTYNKWHPSTVLRILNSSAYIGELVSGKTQTASYKGISQGWRMWSTFMSWHWFA